MIPPVRYPVLGILLGLLLGAATALAGAPPTFDRSELTIETDDGAHRFTIEVARTSEQLAYGLMFRRRLPRDAGMLFDYREPRNVAMWMKNTLIPLDMLFIAADGRIVRIEERTVPMSLRHIPSGEPVRAVLELNGGTAERLGIRVGNRVGHAIFGGTK